MPLAFWAGKGYALTGPWCVFRTKVTTHSDRN